MLAAVVALVVVAVAVKCAIVKLQAAESLAGCYHILAVGAVVHEVSCDEEHIGLLLHYAVKLLGEALAVKGGAEM